MEKQGRHRYHRLASDEVAHMIEALHLAATALTPARRQDQPGTNDASMRMARICYDHLAGRIGVVLADVLIDRDYVRLRADKGEITESGGAFLSE